MTLRLSLSYYINSKTWLRLCVQSCSSILNFCFLDWLFDRSAVSRTAGLSSVQQRTVSKGKTLSYWRCTVVLCKFPLHHHSSVSCDDSFSPLTIWLFYPPLVVIWRSVCLWKRGVWLSRRAHSVGGFFRVVCCSCALDLLCNGYKRFKGTAGGSQRSIWGSRGKWGRKALILVRT